MIRKAVVLSIFFLLIVSVSITGSGHADASMEPTFGGETTEVGDLGEKEYDEKLYGRFFLAPPPIEMNHTQNLLSLQRGEEREFTLTVKYYREVHLQRAEMKDIEPVQGFKVRFLIAKEKWLPSLESLDSQSRGPSATYEPIEMGLEMEEETKIQNHWLGELEEETENIYDLEAEVLQFDPETSAIETSMTLSIDQGGDWYLIYFLKPDGGNYWFSHSFGRTLRKSEDFHIHVERPKGFHSSLPIIATGVIAVVFVYGAVEAKKRS